MLEFILTIITHLIPLILISIPFLILYNLHLKNKSQQNANKEPDINELENKLKDLIEKNNTQANTNELANNL